MKTRTAAAKELLLNRCENCVHFDQYRKPRTTGPHICWTPEWGFRTITDRDDATVCLGWKIDE